MSAPLPESSLADLLRLHAATLYIEGLGERLLAAHGSARAVLSASPELLLRVEGMTRACLERLLSSESVRLAAEEARRLAPEGVSVLERGGPAYPGALEELPGMPLVLEVIGRRDFSTREPCVGLVGSRRPSLYGLRQARRFASELAGRGITIVSGLARGIDAEAHTAALDSGGATVAVLGSGLARMYPPGNGPLAARMVLSEGSAIVSEFPLLAPPLSFHFPMRNRILSGLSDAVLVIEAGERSGSLITARHALEQGRGVYALPGRVDSPEAIGCLKLLRDGAAPAIEPDDILPGWTGPAARPGDLSGEKPSSRDRIGGPYGARLDSLFAEEDAWHPDRIAEALGEPASLVLAELGRLEISGKLVRIEGGRYALARG